MIEGVKNACTKMGEFGSQACTKASELGGRAISWIVETSSTIASKIKEFAVTILFPALKKLGESIATLGRSIADAVKANPKEFAVVAVVVGAVTALVAAVAGFGVSKAMSGDKNSPTPPQTDPAANTSPPETDPTQDPEAGTLTPEPAGS